MRRNGRCAAQRCRRTGWRAGYCCADKRRLWRRIPGIERVAGNVELLCVECIGSQHRQRLRRRLCGLDYQPVAVTVLHAPVAAGVAEDATEDLVDVAQRTLQIKCLL